MLSGVERERGRGRWAGRLLLLFLLVGMFGVGSGSASAATSERGATARGSSGGCGPCPSIVFAKGAGAGAIQMWTTWSDGSVKDESYPLGAGGVETVYVPDPNDYPSGPRPLSAYLRAVPAGTAVFAGWEGCQPPVATQEGDRCRVQLGSTLALCALFKASPSEVVAPGCPPPSVQLYKKGPARGAGKGTVTIQAGARSVQCGPDCSSQVLNNIFVGETVTLRAEPAAGSQFVRWDLCPAAPQGRTCSFTVTGGARVCAVFVQTGVAPPADTTTCPYLTLYVPPKKPPAAKPPRLGARCTIPGSRLGDAIRGTRRNDVMCGRGGHDRLNGGRGHDLVRGGSGNDRLAGAAGNDRLRGESGSDVLNGGAGTDLLEGGTGTDVISSRGDRARDTVSCGRGRDLVYADRLDKVARDCERVRRR